MNIYPKRFADELDIEWIENREAEDDFKIFDLSNRKDRVGIYQMKKTEIEIGRKQVMLTLE